MGTHATARRRGRSILHEADYLRLTKSEKRAVAREASEEAARRRSCLRHIKAERDKRIQEREQILTLEVAEHYSRFGMPHCGDPGGGGYRGKVREFSRAARRRLILDFGKLKEYPPAWVTLTFADDCMDGKTVTERGAFAWGRLKRFIEWIEYHFPGCWGLWRKEWEVRKSGKLKGELCPHYHVMLEVGKVGADLDKALIWILKRWVRQTGTQDENARTVAMRKESRAILDGVKMAQRYVAKYMSKTTLAIFDELDEEESLGRYWGRIGSPPYGAVCVVKLSRYESVWLRRLLHRMCQGKRAKSIGRKLRKGVGWVFARKTTVAELLAWIRGTAYEQHILSESGNWCPF